MSTADWVVLAVIAVSALYGLATGFLRGAFSLAGFAFGAYLGARIAPELLRDASPYVPLVALGSAILLGSLMRGLAGMLAGALRTSLGVIPGVRLLDSVAGLVLGLAAGVLLCWAVGAVLLYLPGQSDLRREVQRSAILSRINGEFPPERLIETLEHVDPIGVFLGPPATVPPPDAALAKDPDVIRTSKSVVRVTGIACGLGIEGSGWIARRGLVVTNAHVVAGISRPRVDLPDGRAYPATVVAFDVTNDLAVLRVPGLRGRALVLAEPDRGTPVALVGYPRNGPLTRTPGRLGGTRKVLSRDAYGGGPVGRQVTTLRGLVEPGSSGGPGIDAQGRVRTTVFARRPGERGGYGIPAELVRKTLAQVRSRPVAATECAR
ncbi:MAG: MarP family serine protease [Thermoleophilia bacterium]|nr:MarP family serine protease [Thermoleophilia bacterium]